ncbi:FAD-dependent monooxygenase [Niallia oryzisoli]|uniref:FAD-dependent monooxygenase n=1 Tax=Niallia oryzisoli TaxID=1737571 RepID=UPI003734D527
MNINTTICIVGGGPSGLLLGLLLAKQGIDVTVIESNGNFERQFRGEVLQPRFIQLIRQLNLDTYLEQYELIKLSSGDVWSGNRKVLSIDYVTDTPEIPYAIRIKQSVLLQALYNLAKKYSSFHFYFNAKAKALIRSSDETTKGVVAVIEQREVTITADLIVGADGRFSTIQRLGNFQYKYHTYDFDMIWFTIPAQEMHDFGIQFKVTPFSNMIAIPSTPTKLQIGFTLKKGEWEKYKENGIVTLRNHLIEAYPFLKNELMQLTNFRPFVPLQAKTFFVNQWYKKGCLLIGDAAHCSSPLGAVGLSLGVETATVAAGIITECLRNQDIEFKKLESLTHIRSSDILLVHHMQKMLTQLFIKNPPFLKKGVVGIIPIASKTVFSKLAKRKFLLGLKKIPIQPNQIFTDNEIMKGSFYFTN